jgi:transposase-like protein
MELNMDSLTLSCPWCDSPAHAEFVDIGVGLQQVAPYTCSSCGARQFYDAEEAQLASPGERSVGWWNPALDPPADDDSEPLIFLHQSFAY